MFFSRYLDVLGGDVSHGLAVELEQRLGLALLETVVHLKTTRATHTPHTYSILNHAQLIHDTP